MTVGNGDHRYQVADGWGRGQRTLGIATGMATDSQDNVYIIDREPAPAVVVFSRDGKLLKTWGEDTLSVPHDIWIDNKDRLYIADCGDHTVRIWSKDGEVLQTIGIPDQSGAPGTPFNRPTRIVRHPSGDMYVSDGYGQEYIHRFSDDGTLRQTWGGRGDGPGQFSLPHNIFVAPDGRLVAADREPNNRIQVFEPDGTFITQWIGHPYPCGLYIDADSFVYIAEGGCVHIYTMDGHLLAYWVVTGGPHNAAHGAHGIWVDSKGDVYVGEVGVGDLYHKYIRI